MAVDNYNTNINVNVNTGQSLAELRSLQAALSTFQQQVNRSNRTAALSADALNQKLISQIGAIQGLSAAQTRIVGTTERFTTALERNKLTLREYARYSSAGFLEGGLGKWLSERSRLIRNAFAQERETLRRAYADRVKLLQSQWIRTSKAGTGGEMGIRVTPTTLNNLSDFTTRTQLAAQRMQILNATLKQGATGLINWGKNTQWAGRQLMVGLTMPLIMLGAVSMKAFKDMEMATLKFRRVYGGLFTTNEETDKAVESIKLLAQEYTKYGVAVSSTMEMAAKAAAMGKVGADLQAQVIQATKLSVLGQVEQEQALETTISLTNAFGIASEDLAEKINFLNAVENQTVLSIEDLTIAIPKAGPVVKQLGGDVKDLAFFLTAMREGGINASEGANALKSGLASLINPTDKASKMLAGFGINIKGIVEANKGDLKATVVSFARALDSLGNDDTGMLKRAQAIEQLFGKFQFARLSALFTNITKEGSQASKVLELMGASVEELAILSERELGKVEESVAVKFQKTLEDLKVTLMPIGKLFMESLMPILKVVGNIIEKFNDFGDGTKKAILAFMIGFPALLMTLGLFGNLIGNTVKGLTMLFFGLAKARSQTGVLGASFNYTTQETIENTSMTYANVGAHQAATNAFNVESAALQKLVVAYNSASAASARLAASNPGLFIGKAAGAKAAVSKLPKKFNRGTANVQYYAKGTDTVPAMLTPGEAVIPADEAQDPKNKPFIQAMLQGKEVQQFDTGSGGVTQSGGGGLTPAQKTQNRSALSYYTKNPNRVAGGIKAAETRRQNALIKETKAIEESAKEKEKQTKQGKQSEAKKLAAEEKKARLGRIAGGASMGLGVAAMGAYATGNAGAGTALMGASLLANFAPLLANPYIAAGAAVLGMTAGIYVLNKVMEGRAKKEEQFVRSVTASTDQMRRVSEMTDTIGASQIMAERRKSGAFSQYSEAERKGRGFGSQFLSSDIGKEVYKAFNTNKDIYGTARAAEQLSTQLAAYISDGIMTAEQANSIADQISVNLGDATIRTKIEGELRGLIGPNGENLLKAPLETRLNLIQANEKQVRKLSKDEGFQSLAEVAKQQDTFYQTESTARLRAGAAQMAGYAAQATEFAQAQLDALTIYYEKQEKSLRTALEQTTDLKKRAEIEAQILELKTRQEAEEKVLQKEVGKSLSRSFKQFKKLQEEKDAFGFGFSTAQEKQEDAYFDALKGKIKDIYKGTEFETGTKDLLSRLAKLSDENFGPNDEYNKAGFKTATEAQDFEVRMQLLLANKQANADQITSFMSLFSGKDLAKGAASLDLSIKTRGAAKTFELQSMLAGMSGKGSKKLAQDMFVKLTAITDEQSFTDAAMAVANLSEMDGEEVNMKVSVESLGEQGLIKLGKELRTIENMPDVTKKTVEQTLKSIGMPQGGIDTITANWEYYEKLPPEIRKEAIQDFLTIYTFRTNFQDPEARKQWLMDYQKTTAAAAVAQSGGNEEVRQIIYNIQMGKVEGKTAEQLAEIERGLIQGQIEDKYGDGTVVGGVVPGVDGSTGGGRASKDSALDDLLKKLKFIRDAAINAEGGVKELLRITSGKGVKKFEGVTQQLLGGLGKGGKGGFNREFISFLEGLDNATRKTFMTVKKGKVVLTEAGKAAKEAFNEKVIGEFQVAQVKTIQDTKAQQAALLRLQASGVSTSTALQMVADANLAVAINSKSITNTELKQMAKDAEEAKNKVRELNLELKNTVDEMKETGTDLGESLAVITKIKELRPDASLEFLKSLASDKSAIDGFYDAFFKGAKNNLQTLKDYIDQYFKNNKIKIELDAIINPNEISRKIQDAFDKAKSKVEAYLSAERARITLNVAPPSVMNALQRDVQVAQDGVAAAQNALSNVTDSAGLTIADYETQIQYLQDTVLAGFDSQIRELSQKIEREQDRINSYYDKLIDPLKRTIEETERMIEMSFNRPIEALQRESSDLSNDLTLIDKAAEAINEKYDKQEEALNKISEINQDIINQQKSQITLADALTQGDISAAAQAAQEMRAQAAEAASRNAGDVLGKARESEIGALRSASGMTRLQIEERQFKISQQIFNLEKARQVELDKIQLIQDRIFELDKARQKELDALIPDIERLAELERQRAAVLDEIEKKEDAIAKIKASKAYQDALKAVAEAEKELKKAQAALEELEKKLRDALAEVDEQKAKWEDVLLSIEEAGKGVVDFETLLKNAKEAAKLLADEMERVAAIDEGKPFDSSILDSPPGAVPDPNLDRDSEKAALARRSYMRSNDPALNTGATAKGSKTAQMAANLKSAATSSVTLEAAIKKIATSTNLTEEDLKLISGYIKTSSEAMPSIVTAFTNLTPLIQAQIEPLGIMTQLFKDQVTPVETIRKEIEKFIGDIAWFLNPKNLEGMTVFLIEWGLVKELILKINEALNLMLQTLLKNIIEQMEVLRKAAEKVTKEIQSWNTTVTTRHVIEVEYRYLNAPPPGAGEASMYGGMIKPKMYGGSIKPMLHGGRIGSDSVPILATPGEFMVNEYATKQFLPFLTAINESKFPSVLANKLSQPSNFALPIFTMQNMSAPTYGVSSPTNISTAVRNDASYNNNSNLVYNYNVGINVGGSNATPNTIAKAVLDEIKYYDSQNIRGVRI